MNPVNVVNAEPPVFGLRDPDERGYFGAYGGRFVPETLVAPIEELTRAYLTARADASFSDELTSLLQHYVGRPTPLYETRRLARETRPANAAGPAEAGHYQVWRSYFARAGLTHTGTDLTRLARHCSPSEWGRRVVAETGRPHGVATATACALLGPRVSRLWARKTCAARRSTSCACGPATRVRSTPARRERRDQRSDARLGPTLAIRHLLVALGPHPYPLMVREFQSVITAGPSADARSGRSPPGTSPCVGIKQRGRILTASSTTRRWLIGVELAASASPGVTRPGLRAKHRCA